MMIDISDDLRERLYWSVQNKLPRDYFVPYKPRPEYQISLRKDLTENHCLLFMGNEISNQICNEIYPKNNKQ